MSESHYFCFACYARSLQEAFLERPSDTAIVHLLLDFIIVEGDVKSGAKGKGDQPYEITANKANRLMNRKDVIYSKLVDATKMRKVIHAADKHFSDNIVPKINPHAIDDLIKKLLVLIRNDHIAEEKEADLCVNADTEHLALFLADALFYALSKNNKIKDNKKSKLSLRQAEAESLSAESLQMILPEDKLNLIVETVISRIVQVGSLQKLDGFRIQSFKEEELHRLLQVLISDGRMSCTELYYCNNFLQIAKKVDEIIQEQQKSDEDNRSDTDDRDSYISSDFNFDWLLRFYEACGAVSDEEMQSLWAKILAGELRQSGSFSLRTIETLRNMSPEEAAKLRVISGLVVSDDAFNKLLFYDNQGLCFREYRRLGINSIDVNDMIDLGVLRNSATDIICTVKNDSYGTLHGLYFDDYFLGFRNLHNPREKFKHASQIFTKVGMELLSIIRTKPNYEFFYNLKILYRNDFDILLLKRIQTQLEHGIIEETLDYDCDYFIMMFGDNIEQAERKIKMEIEVEQQIDDPLDNY